jgi:hypothetical protein
MTQFISIALGLLAALVMLFGLVPFLGWAQWFALAACVVGIIFGSFCEKKTGLIINVAVGLVAALRLLLGGGLL